MHEVFHTELGEFYHRINSCSSGEVGTRTLSYRNNKEDKNSFSIILEMRFSYRGENRHWIDSYYSSGYIECTRWVQGTKTGFGNIITYEKATLESIGEMFLWWNRDSWGIGRELTKVEWLKKIKPRVSIQNYSMLVEAVMRSEL
jgi:hypothetical protein